MIFLKFRTEPYKLREVNMETINDDEKNQRESDCRKLWRKADAVCFDVDSTVCQDEVNDELAKFLGVYDEVHRLTEEAMEGNMTFGKSLEIRMAKMHPTRIQFKNFVENFPIKLTPDISDLIKELQTRNVSVYLISGGWKDTILKVAEALNIDSDHIFSNDLIFHENGDYAEFDRSSPVSDSGGKAKVCGHLKNDRRFKTLIMIGDGSTDAEAAPPADAFIGFGGNRVRKNVVEKSDWFVYDFKSLLDELLKK